MQSGRFRNVTCISGRVPDSCHGVQDVVPPEVMLPERRLEILVEQALQSQLASCPFHNAQPAAVSLLHDFQCGREQIPTCTTQVTRVVVPLAKFKFLFGGTSKCLSP